MSYTGPGGSGHVQALILNQFGYYPALTAYSGGNDCYIAVMGGQVVFTNSNYSTVASLIDAGELKLLAVSATERMPKYPDVPALSEKLENIQGVYVMGKAASLNGVRGDVIIPTKVRSALLPVRNMTK